MKEYILNNKIPEAFSKNLKAEYFDKMEKGQKFIYLAPYLMVTGDIEAQWDIDEQNYDNNSTFVLMMSKVSRDSKKLADENLKFINKYCDNQRQYCVYVYEK